MGTGRSTQAWVHTVVALWEYLCRAEFAPATILLADLLSVVHMPRETPTFRTTRSGRSFAEWAGPKVAVQNPNLNIEELLKISIAKADALEDEDFEEEEFSLSPLTSPEASPPTSPSIKPTEIWDNVPSSILAETSDLLHPVGLGLAASTVHINEALCSGSPPSHPRIPTPPKKATNTGIAAPMKLGCVLSDPHRDPRQCSPPIKLPNLSENIDTDPTTEASESGAGSLPEHRRNKRQLQAKYDRRKVKRAKLKAETYGGGHQPRPSIQAKHVTGSIAVEVNAGLENARVASTAYVGLDNGENSTKTYSMKELLEMGFQHHCWNGINPTPITANKQFIGLLAGRPRSDRSWDALMVQAAEALERNRQKCRATSKQTNHRRGEFTALASGVSHGGGQRRPGNLTNNTTNKAVLDELNAMDAFRRLAGFASSAMCNWTPDLYKYYVKRLGELFAHYPSLKRNFDTSVFTANTYNLGPQTVCLKHTDYANLPFGLCAITALGSFDPTKGGQLVLWECKLIIDFPPGSTILIPSAIITHFNLPIQSDESRYSFTQFSAGQLFGWVENGFQKSTCFWTSLSPEAREEEMKKKADRWAFGLSLLPVLDIPKTVSPPM